MASVQNLSTSDVHTTATKEPSSIFTIGNQTHKSSLGVPAIITVPKNSPGPNSSAKHSTAKPAAGMRSSGLAKSLQLSSPVWSPVIGSDSLTERPDCNIFERSVQETAPVKLEDFIPPALNATAEILSDKDTNLDEVEMIYSVRKNSSVIGLNMALRRPYTPLGKNSVQSMSQTNTAVPNSASPQLPVSPPKLISSRSSVSFYSYADMINSDEFARRPSILHAYSHAVVPTLSLSDDRKMSINLAYSAGSSAGNNMSGAPHSPTSSGLAFGKLSRKATGNSITSTHSQPQSQLSKQIKDRQVLQRRQAQASEENPQRFLISPELSESEEHEAYNPVSGASDTSSRRISLNSIVSNELDTESFVSNTVAEVIRKCSTKISGH